MRPIIIIIIAVVVVVPTSLHKTSDPSAHDRSDPCTSFFSRRVSPACSAAAIDMAAEDCFEIASLAYSSGRIGHFHSWTKEAARLLRGGHHDGTLAMSDVLEHLAWAEYLVS